MSYDSPSKALLYWALRWHDHPGKKTEYTWPGCLEGCKHRFVATEISIDYCPLCGPEYTFEHTEIFERCRIQAKCTERRTEIYKSANILLDDLLTAGRVRAAQNAWEKKADEFEKTECPFFENNV